MSTPAKDAAIAPRPPVATSQRSLTSRMESVKLDDSEVREQPAPAAGCWLWGRPACERTAIGRRVGRGWRVEAVDWGAVRGVLGQTRGRGPPHGRPRTTPTVPCSPARCEHSGRRPSAQARRDLHRASPRSAIPCVQSQRGVRVRWRRGGGRKRLRRVPDSWFLERGAWKLCPARGAFCIKGNRSTHLRAPLGAGQRGGSIQGTPPGGRAHEACAIASWWFHKLWLACWLKLKLTLSGSGLAQLCTIL